MVLVLDGAAQDAPPTDSRALFRSRPRYKDGAARLATTPVQTVGPAGLLYVQQREMAATAPSDHSVAVLGSDDATTCLIAVLRHSGSGAVALAHLDGAGTDGGVALMARRVRDMSVGCPDGRLELQLVGAFADGRRHSEELFRGAVLAFHRQPDEVHLTLACVGEGNTAVRGGVPWPILYGVAIRVRTGELFPATFPDKGPAQELRSARQLTGGREVLDVYDHEQGLLRVGPFDYEPLSGVEHWLRQTDEFILQHMSTSPQVEPPLFVAQIRATLKYMRDHPVPAVTVFRGNRPHYYRRDSSGLWAPVDD